MILTFMLKEYFQGFDVVPKHLLLIVSHFLSLSFVYPAVSGVKG